MAELGTSCFILAWRHFFARTRIIWVNRFASGCWQSVAPKPRKKTLETSQICVEVWRTPEPSWKRQKGERKSLYRNLSVFCRAYPPRLVGDREPVGTRTVPLAVTCETVTSLPPVLETVTVCFWLVPIGTFVKVRVEGDRDSAPGMTDCLVLDS